MDADWHAFCHAIYEGIEATEWAELYFNYRETSKAAGARKPSESQKAKALWAMKAAKDRREEFCDSPRKDNILRRKQTRLELWEGPNHSLGQSSEVLGESVSRLTFGSRHLMKKSCQFQWPLAGKAQSLCQRCGKDLSGKAFGLIWTRGIARVCAQLPLIRTFRGSMGRTASSFSSSFWWLEFSLLSL